VKNEGKSSPEKLLLAGAVGPTHLKNGRFNWMINQIFTWKMVGNHQCTLWEKLTWLAGISPFSIGNISSIQVQSSLLCWFTGVVKLDQVMKKNNLKRT